MITLLQYLLQIGFHQSTIVIFYLVLVLQKIFVFIFAVATIIFSDTKKHIRIFSPFLSLEDVFESVRDLVWLL